MSARRSSTALAAREVAEALPGARGATLLRAPSSAKNRRRSRSPPVSRRARRRAPAVDGLFLAGDWIDTGLPGTIESAVVSGHRAARELLNADDR